MASVHIARKREPVIIANDRAKQLKEKLLDSRVPRETMVDLGTWMGSIGEIKSIEIEEDISRHHTAIEDIGKDEERGAEEFRKLPIAEKAGMLSEFVFHYQKTHEFKRPPFEVLEKARKIQTNYYQANPEALFVPSEEFKDLI
jgi:hypothetical protein